ncbi:MAG: ABC transporter ATP-binding protein [Clostridia bacterium]|nr:ABC transporter ATP-binding protein [Clostridia bacterium]
MLAIQTKALTKSYGDICAVSALDLEVRQGELYSLLGVNGAGKSTTIRLLCGLLDPTSGSAEVCGHDVVSKRQTVKERINLSPQETAIAPNLTVEENIAFFAGIYGKEKSCVQNIIEKLHLGEIVKQKAKTLSGGWQRRLSIAIALVTEPEVLFLDEPTLGLDVLARRELWSLIRSLKGKTTVILTTHYLEEAEALSDRIGILSAGKLIAVGTADELIAQTGTASFEDAFVTLCTKEADDNAQ